MSFEKPELNKPEKETGSFDREAEKEKRKEIRKMLEHALTEVLKPVGFKKEGVSTWLREIKDKIQIVYLQKSQFGHTYYIEAGVCDSKNLGGKKPRIIDCLGNKRLEGIVSELDIKEYSEEEAREKEQGIRQLLEFEVPHEIPKKLEDYETLVPSVDIAEAQNKIESLKKIMKENVPAWLDEQSK